jgi:hypothetical protein
MTWLQKITRSNFFIKLRNWEYWPFGVVQFPVIIYYLWLALRSRSLIFFSASNPGIDMGGMFGESKYDILKKIPRQYIPNTSLIKLPATTPHVMNVIRSGGFSMPVIFKPDLGERGFMVKKISSEKDVEQYLEKIKIDFLIQDLVDLPLEFGIFYVRFPSEKNGRVTSVTGKEMLTITGDGKATLQELILKKDRAKLQWTKLRETYRDRLGEIIAKDQKIELVSIGNHALGTKFLNGNYLINEKLSSVFDTISKQIDGFYFGRFDIRCRTIEDLYSGNIKIMELNGCGAEPAHIYDPGFPLNKALGVMLQHWKNIFLIARENQRRGVQFTSFKEAKNFYRKFKHATK